jgi:hypothetical protein
MESMSRSASKKKPMGRYAVVIFALVLTISGCRDTGDQPLVTSVDPSAPERVLPSPPPGLLAHLRVGPLPRVLDEVADVGHRLGAWTVKPGELWPLVKEVMVAATDLADIVDWRRAIHLLILDPKAHPGTVAFILPVRHPDRALGRLSGRCRAHRKGALWVFSGGGRGLVPCRFVARTLAGGILVARRPAALKTVWRFALLTAQNDRGPGPSPGPGPALEARVFVKAGLTKAGLTPQKLDQLTKIGSLGLAMALGDLDAAPRLEAQLTQAFAYATSARDLGLSVDLANHEVRVRLFATAQPKGALRRYIDGRRPAPLADLSALDRRAPLALSLAGPAVSPGAKRSKKPEQGLVLAALLSRLPDSLRKPMGRFVSRLLGHQGATQISINPLDTGGLCLVALVDHPRPQELAADVHRDLVKGLAGLRKHLQERGFGAKALTTPPGRKVGEMRIQETALGGKWPAGSLGLQLALQWISGGDTLRLATAVHGQRLVIALGAGAQAQVQATGRRLKASRRIARTRPPLAPHRLGRARLSLVELVRAVPILGAGMTLPKVDTGGLELHWGVDPARRQVDATLHLPLSHLMASAPLWQWLIDKIETQTQALGALAVPTGPEPDDAL